MRSRRVVLLTPSVLFHPRQLPFCQQPPSVNSLAATLTVHLASAANKRLTENLSPVDATLTKKRGVGVLPPLRFLCALRVSPLDHVFLVSTPKPNSRTNPRFSAIRQMTKTYAALSSQPLTNCPFSIPFVLTFIHVMGGVPPHPSHSQRAFSPLLQLSNRRSRASRDRRSKFPISRDCQLSAVDCQLPPLPCPETDSLLYSP